MFPSNGTVGGPGGKFLGRWLARIYFVSTATRHIAQRQRPAIRVLVFTVLETIENRAILIVWSVKATPERSQLVEI